MEQGSMLESMEKAADNNVRDYARNVGSNQAIEHARKVLVTKQNYIKVVRNQSKMYSR